LKTMRQATLFDSEPSTQVADEAPEPAWAGTPPERLHRIHVAPALGTGGSSFDVEGVRWRGDAGTASWKRSVAYLRLSTTYQAETPDGFRGV
jgi:hypothetical protein